MTWNVPSPYLMFTNKTKQQETKQVKRKTKQNENSSLNQHNKEGEDNSGKVECHPSLAKMQPCSQPVFDIAEGFVLITFNKIQSKDNCLGSLSNKVLSLITILYYQ